MAEEPALNDKKVLGGEIMAKPKDKFLIEQLMEFLPDSFAWEDGDEITMSDIKNGINERMEEEEEPYGGSENVMHQSRSKEWHISRILYFVNHPEEICGIEVDNFFNGFSIEPVPVIVDGHHRFLAAVWLYKEGRMTSISSHYSGYVDLFNYLSGISDIKPV